VERYYLKGLPCRLGILPQALHYFLVNPVDRDVSHASLRSAGTSPPSDDGLPSLDLPGPLDVFVHASF
jgi:hypothetical protein